MLKWLEFKLCANKGFLSFLSTFAHKVVKTWFALHETLHPTLAGIYYFVKVARILNHCHILKITW